MKTRLLLFWVMVSFAHAPAVVLSLRPFVVFAQPSVWSWSTCFSTKVSSEEGGQHKGAGPGVLVVVLLQGLAVAPCMVSSRCGPGRSLPRCAPTVCTCVSRCVAAADPSPAASGQVGSSALLVPCAGAIAASALLARCAMAYGPWSSTRSLSYWLTMSRPHSPVATLRRRPKLVVRQAPEAVGPHNMSTDLSSVRKERGTNED